MGQKLCSAMQLVAVASGVEAKEEGEEEEEEEEEEERRRSRVRL